jgi:thiol-disulfide isomerase/thioredoxin
VPAVRAVRVADKPSYADEWEAVRTPAKAFDVPGLTGGRLRSADLAGKIVVLDFWASWCQPCVRELPALAAYHQRLEARSDVALLSLNVGEDRPAVEAFLKASPVGFPVYCGDSLVGPYELAAFPTKLVIDLRHPAPDGSGVIRFRREGLTSVESIEARVAALLAEKP